MSIYDNTIGLSVSIHGFGNSKGIDKATMAQVMPDLSDKALSEYVHTTRKLIVCDEFSAIQTLDTCYSAWLKRKSVPSLFRKGIYLIPLASVDEINTHRADYESQREKLVETLGEVWPERWAESQAETGQKFGYMPCPAWERVKARYYTEHKYLSLDVPGKLKYVSDEVFHQAQNEMRARLLQVEKDITAMLRGEALEQTQVLINKLKGLDTGETKRFSQGHILHLKEWCQTFLAGRNVTDDHELEEQAKELHEVLEQVIEHDGSVPTDLLRNSYTFRHNLINAVQCIGNALQGLVEDMPVRELVLED